MQLENLTREQLQDKLEDLRAERDELQAHWMAPDEDDDWQSVQNEIDAVEKLLR